MPLGVTYNALLEEMETCLWQAMQASSLEGSHLGGRGVNLLGVEQVTLHAYVVAVVNQVSA